MEKKSFLLGCFTSLSVLIIILIVTILLIFFGIKNKLSDIPIVSDSSYIEISITTEIKEYNNIDFYDNTPSVKKITEKIISAKDDDRVHGLILKFVSPLSLGYSSVREFSEAIKIFKKSNKKVYAYIDFAMDRDYLLATVSDRIALNPSASAGILLRGISVQNIYLKEFLNRLGIEIKVLKTGKAKSFGEIFTDTLMSRDTKENYKVVFGNFFNEIKDEIVSNRKIKNIKDIYQNRDRLIINSFYAIDLSLVDTLTYYKDFLVKNSIHNKINIVDYTPKVIEEKEDKIAVVYLSGEIISSNNETGYLNTISKNKIESILDQIDENEKIKAIVLRINSGGGSSLEADIILNQVLSKVDLPLVISMGDIAASGAYYISSKADYIFADVFTITGSIGVFSLFPYADELANKMGLNSDGIKFGEFSNIFNPFQTPNKNHLKIYQAQIEDVYNDFKKNVATGRNMSMLEVERNSQGLIFTGKMAKERGLVDEVGTLYDAIDKASQLAKIDEFSIVYYPRKKSILEYIMDPLSLIGLIQNKSLNELKLFVKNILFQKTQTYQNIEVK